jgi:hypothetical protein
MPKLAVVAQVTENDIAVLLDRRIKRIQEIEAGKLLEARPQSAPDVEPVDARLPPRTSDKRFRRI